VFEDTGHYRNTIDAWKFIEDKNEVFKCEIYAAGLFDNLLHEGG
jgi:hypothetical protein